jgi:hypothetical protein
LLLLQIKARPIFLCLNSHNKKCLIEETSSEEFVLDEQI